MQVNTKKLVVSSILSGFFYISLSFLTEGVFLSGSFKQATIQGTLLSNPRIPQIVIIYGLSLFIVAFIITGLYAVAIADKRRSIKKALFIGTTVGFCVSFPMNISTASWMPADPLLSVWVMAYLWIGAIGSSVIAWAVYRE